MTSSSYFLDRDGLGSTRPIIDAHSNVPFAQHTYRSSYGASSPALYTTNCHHHGYANGLNENIDGRKIAADVSELLPFTRAGCTARLFQLQEQVRVLKKDLEKKDALIQELTSMK